MGLKPGGEKQGTGMIGVFINLDKITDVQDVTGMGQFPTDVALKLIFPEKTTKAGTKWQPNMTIYGDFEKDGQGLIIGWGSAFKIDRLINHIGGWNKELESREVPADALTSLIGKDIYHLQYCIGRTADGKRKMRDYQIVANFMEGNEPGDLWLLENFRRQLADGRIKNYDPDAYSDEPTNGTTVAKVAEVLGGNLGEL